MDSDADDDQLAMAEAMGFSSFGAQDRPQKKRRYNPHADAAVIATPGHAETSSTGANSTPLGAPSASVAGGNADEIDLDDDDQGSTSTLAGTAESGSTQARPSGTVPPHLAGLPQRPGPAVGGAGPFGHGGQRAAHQGGARLNKDGTGREWYEGYYDSTSNENPWDRLEKSLGLQSIGTWVSRHANPAAVVSP